MNKKTRFVSLKTFREIVKDEAVEAENVAIRKSFFISKMDEITESDEKPTLKFSITTEDVDRDGDTIKLNGWDFTDFSKNPVVLWAHDYSAPPVAKAINIFRANNTIDSTAEFTPKRISEFGHMIFQMYKGGFLNAVSVGFQPSEFELARDRESGLNFLKQSLMEYSAVPVPSNPKALIQARSFGIDTAPMKIWAENVLDDWEKSGEGILIPKTELELIRTNSDKKNAVSMPVKNDTTAQASIEQVKEKQSTKDDKNEKVETKLTADKVQQSSEGVKKWADVTKAMENVLGKSSDKYPDEEDYEIYQSLCTDYRTFDKNPPEIKYFHSQILRHLPDDYYLNKDNGQIEKLTDEIKLTQEMKTVRTIFENIIKSAKSEHVKNAVTEALNTINEFKELPCCDEHGATNEGEQEKDTSEVLLELDAETGGEETALIDPAITPETIAEIVQQAVDEEMRKRTGKLD